MTAVRAGVVVMAVLGTVAAGALPVAAAPARTPSALSDAALQAAMLTPAEVSAATGYPGTLTASTLKCTDVDFAGQKVGNFFCQQTWLPGAADAFSPSWLNVDTYDTAATAQTKFAGRRQGLIARGWKEVSSSASSVTFVSSERIGPFAQIASTWAVQGTEIVNAECSRATDQPDQGPLITCSQALSASQLAKLRPAAGSSATTASQPTAACVAAKKALAKAKKSGKPAAVKSAKRKVSAACR